MVNWKARPLEEVNGIKFGMEREEVRKLLGGEVREFKKSKFSKMTTDDFGCCHVYYDKENKCEAIEIFEDSEVYIDGKIIFPTTIEGAKGMLKDLEEESGSYVSTSQSIGIYAPMGEMESILFGNRGYYD